jgi:hypothetical protein
MCDARTALVLLRLWSMLQYHSLGAFEGGAMQKGSVEGCFIPSSWYPLIPDS